MVLEDFGLVIDDCNLDWVGVIIGCGLGGLGILEFICNILDKRGFCWVSLFFIFMMIGNMVLGMIFIYLGVRGFNVLLVIVCVVGVYVIGDFFKIIGNGLVDVMIIGGVEVVVNLICIVGFNVMKVLFICNDELEKVLCLFECDCDGFVVGEGSGIMIIEVLEYVFVCDVWIYVEIIGYGMIGDGYYMIVLLLDGNGVVCCMEVVLDDVGFVFY